MESSHLSQEDIDKFNDYLENAQPVEGINQ